MDTKANCATEVATLKEYIAEIASLAKQHGATFMYAKVETIGTFKNVSVNLPTITSGYLQKIKEHMLWIAGSADLENNPEQIQVPAHYYFPSLHGGKKLHRHFYTKYPGDFGQTLVAKEVAAKIKTNFFSGEKSLVLDIVLRHSDGARVRPEYKLRIGPDDQTIGEKEKFLIPDTNEFVAFRRF